MKLGIMQPYLFPYLGYFQLINCVDTFVVLDDVQFVKRGWINRNRILLDKKPFLFTFSVKKDSQNLNISERYFSHQFDIEGDKFLKTLYHAYGKAPYYEQVIPLITSILDFEKKKCCFISIA